VFNASKIANTKGPHLCLSYLNLFVLLTLIIRYVNLLLPYSLTILDTTTHEPYHYTTVIAYLVEFCYSHYQPVQWRCRDMKFLDVNWF